MIRYIRAYVTEYYKKEDKKMIDIEATLAEELGLEVVTEEK